MYADGRGVPQDYKAAIKWYALAAKQAANMMTKKSLEQLLALVRSGQVTKQQAVLALSVAQRAAFAALPIFIGYFGAYLAGFYSVVGRN